MIPLVRSEAEIVAAHPWYAAVKGKLRADIELILRGEPAPKPQRYFRCDICGSFMSSPQALGSHKKVHR